MAGQAKYYLDQAEARVDTVQSVADGLEDYYVAGTETRGGWLGRGAAELGLERRSIRRCGILARAFVLPRST